MSKYPNGYKDKLDYWKGEYEQAAQILEHKFDLKLLYPKRKRFHISEVVNFMGVVGTYFVDTGQRETARRYYDVLREIAPVSWPKTSSVRRSAVLDE